jgi:hypothetical protein
MRNDGYDWTEYKFKVGEELDVLDLMDEVWCHVTVVKVHNGPKGRAITVHWTGWDNNSDTEIPESAWADLLAPVGTHVQQVRCWVTLVNAASLPKWPAVVHIRQPSTDPRHRRGQHALMEKTMVIFVMFCLLYFIFNSHRHCTDPPFPPTQLFVRICGNSKQLTRLQNYRLLDNGAWMCTTGKSSAHFQPYNGDDDAADAELKRAGAAGPHTVLRFALAPLSFHFSFLLTACCLFTVSIGLSPVAGVCGGLRGAGGLYRPDLRPA